MLVDIKKKYENSEIDATTALSEIFQIYLPSEEKLKLYSLKLIPGDYGLFQLRQSGEYICEGDKPSCLERAYKIMNK
jgi:hypothetical protein